ncbi:hypothetical protein ACP70R_018976 [Stipagrostis hirtigluma subsp. patula]
MSACRPTSFIHSATPRGHTVPRALLTIDDDDPTIFLRDAMACHLGLASAAVRAPRLAVLAAASSAAGGPVRRIRRRAPPGRDGSAPAPPAQPSVEEVRRAIGVADDASSSAASREAQNSAFMDLVAATPIGQPESEPERRLREAAEWVVDTSEVRVCEGQKSFLVLCMMTFPAWFLLMLVALGVIKLPFDIPGLDKLLMLLTCLCSYYIAISLLNVPKVWKNNEDTFLLFAGRNQEPENLN